MDVVDRLEGVPTDGARPARGADRDRLDRARRSRRLSVRGGARAPRTVRDELPRVTSDAGHSRRSRASMSGSAIGTPMPPRRRGAAPTASTDVRRSPRRRASPVPRQSAPAALPGARAASISRESSPPARCPSAARALAPRPMRIRDAFGALGVDQGSCDRLDAGQQTLTRDRGASASPASTLGALLSGARPRAAERRLPSARHCVMLDQLGEQRDAASVDAEARPPSPRPAVDHEHAE